MFKQTIAIAALAAGCVMASELPAEGKLDSVDRFLAEDALESLNHDAKEAEYGWEQELNGDVQNGENDRDLENDDGGDGGNDTCEEGEICWADIGKYALYGLVGFVGLCFALAWPYFYMKYPKETM